MVSSWEGDAKVGPDYVVSWRLFFVKSSGCICTRSSIPEEDLALMSLDLMTWKLGAPFLLVPPPHRSNSYTLQLAQEMRLILSFLQMVAQPRVVHLQCSPECTANGHCCWRGTRALARCSVPDFDAPHHIQEPWLQSLTSLGRRPYQ